MHKMKVYISSIPLLRLSENIFAPTDQPLRWSPSNFTTELFPNSMIVSDGERGSMLWLLTEILFLTTKLAFLQCFRKTLFRKKGSTPVFSTIVAFKECNISFPSSYLQDCGRDQFRIRAAHDYYHFFLTYI